MTDRLKWLEKSDLGLSYEEASHGVQSAIAFKPDAKALEPKHMRVGIDMSKADMLALVCLLIDKGVFTSEEYLEYVRLAANCELKAHQSKEFSFR